MMQGQSTIVVKVSTTGGQLVSVADLVPLVPTLESVVADTALRGGPRIDPARITMAADRFPLIDINGWTIACQLGCEHTLDETESLTLRKVRARNLRRAIAEISQDRWAKVDSLAGSPALARAAFILTGVVETGILVARTGAMTRTIDGMVFDGRFGGSQPPDRPAARGLADMNTVRRTIH